jgi:hypothetical protein
MYFSKGMRAQVLEENPVRIRVGRTHTRSARAPRHG